MSGDASGTWRLPKRGLGFGSRVEAFCALSAVLFVGGCGGGDGSCLAEGRVHSWEYPRLFGSACFSLLRSRFFLLELEHTIGGEV